MASSTVAVKVTLGTTTRRIALARAPPPAYRALVDLIANRFSLPISHSVHLSCKDDEGDWITVVRSPCFAAGLSEN